MIEGFDLTKKRILVAGGETPVGQAILAAVEEAGGVVDLTPPPPSRPLDGAVWAGGVPQAGPFVDLTDEDWDALVAANLTAPLRFLRAAARQMLAGGGPGRLVLVHSLLAVRGVPNTAAYGACQAGLTGLIRALSLEWARQDLRINGLGLGWFEDDPLVARDAARLARFLPTRRFGRPEEVGATAVYLLSDAADMMTGQTLYVDGGALAHA
jgi:NAD(P)-dependent dehydrogenase (short-subunit alcohol dehydrogenase family)